MYTSVGRPSSVIPEMKLSGSGKSSYQIQFPSKLKKNFIYLAISDNEIGKTLIVLPPMRYSDSALADFFLKKPKKMPMRMHRNSMAMKKR